MKRTLFFVSLVGLAFLVRVAVLTATGRLHAPEVWEYEVMADNLLAGKGLVYPLFGTTYHAFTGPLYPALCALVYALTAHSQTAMALVCALLSSLIPAVAAQVAWRTFSSGEAVVTGLLVAFHPGLLIYTTKLHALILDALLMALVVLGCLKLDVCPCRRHRIGLGLWLGLCILNRPTVILSVPFLIPWFLWRRALPLKRKILELVLILGVAFVCMVPWALWNLQTHHRLTFLQSTSGLSFWKGNNPHASGGNLDRFGQDILRSMPPALEARLYATQDEFEQNAIFWQEGIRFVADAPLLFLGLFLKKLAKFFLFPMEMGWWYPPWYLRLYWLWYALILPLVGVGVWKAFTSASPLRWRAALLVLGFVGAIGVGQSLFYVEGRHRWHVESLLLVFAGAGAVACLKVRPMGRQPFTLPKVVVQ